jgi:hypothetical protein
MDAHQVPMGVNESNIEKILEQWEHHGESHLPEYWLVAARLLEMSILLAGHYVDHCEFKAAGDLLFNPRRILIYQKDSPRPLVKQRHGRLSDQLNGPAYRSANEPFPQWFRQQVVTQISRPAILPHLLSLLEQSERLTKVYLRTAQCRLEKASQAIGFLCSWSIFNVQELNIKMQAASPSARRFIHRHLCLFDTTLFDALGKEVQQLGMDSEYQSHFIMHPALLDTTSGTGRRS